ncbi:hypothetical protein [Burkholderia cepacia]|uniref:hypothetical protein n=1 Tax=Burkholderia cepacia TaxID=292 RepID=UPI0015903F26|nr:hypothetical protein [Burkholderia cepacia]
MAAGVPSPARFQPERSFATGLRADPRNTSSFCGEPGMAGKSSVPFVFALSIRIEVAA